MIESIRNKDGGIIYFDFSTKSIARIPSKSNMKGYGADNSLYFGVIGKTKIEPVLCKMFGIDKLTKLIGKKWNLNLHLDKEYEYDVTFNINKEGQLQFRFTSSSIRKSFNDFCYFNKEELSYLNYFLVINFSKNNIFYKPKDDFEEIL